MHRSLAHSLAARYACTNRQTQMQKKARPAFSPDRVRSAVVFQYGSAVVFRAIPHFSVSALCPLCFPHQEKVLVKTKAPGQWPKARDLGLLSFFLSLTRTTCLRTYSLAIAQGKCVHVPGKKALPVHLCVSCPFMEKDRKC